MADQGLVTVQAFGSSAELLGWSSRKLAVVADRPLLDGLADSVHIFGQQSWQGGTGSSVNEV